MNINLWLSKIFRLSAGLLFILLFLYFLSGFGMTRVILDRELAQKLHKEWLPPLAMLALLPHSFLGLRITLMRWRWWNKLTLLLVSLIYLFLVGAFIFVAYFYRSVEQDSPSISQTLRSLAPTSSVKSFTREELAPYNGLNGQPAYVAVDGVVYNLSLVFINGKHQGHSAGQDLTSAFHSQHLKSILTKFPQVGVLN